MRLNKYALSSMMAVGLCLAAALPAAAAPPGHRGHHRGWAEGSRWELLIPAIGVAAPIVRLEGPRDGKLAVPSLAQAWDVGWYRYGAVPGQRGNAVMFGHVDTHVGPAVFYNLYLLRPGESVYVLSGHRSPARFTVRRIEEVPKASFPVGTVFGPASRAQLWLVTCGGRFDYRTRSYESNIIVSAVLAAPHRWRIARHS